VDDAVNTSRVQISLTSKGEKAALRYLISNQTLKSATQCHRFQ
jgi:hypothetical protein